MALYCYLFSFHILCIIVALLYDADPCQNDTPQVAVMRPVCVYYTEHYFISSATPTVRLVHWYCERVTLDEQSNSIPVYSHASHAHFEINNRIHL